MMQEFRLQDPGEGIHEAEILEILVAEGETVEEGQNVLEVETDKAVIEIPSPFSGTVESIRVSQGDIAHVGDVLLTVREPSDGADKGGNGEAREAPERDPDREREAGGRGDGQAAPRERRQAGAGDGKRRPGRQAGDGEDRAEAQATTAERAEAEAPAAPASGRHPVPATPAVRRRARELGVALGEIRGTGEDGRVTMEDVESAGQERRPARVRPALPDFGRWGAVERVPLRSVRRATARRMAEAWAEIPHVSHQDRVDITALEAFRRRHKDRVEAEGGRLTLTVFALKAAAAALREHPRFNASLDWATEEIVLKDYIHIGIAFDSERGLLVPVLRDVDRKSLTALAHELAALGDRVRAGKLAREEMEGGSFTITNVGPLGGTGFAPIVNHPEVAILGLAQARWMPVTLGEAEDAPVVSRFMLPLCLAFDHRVVDGADAARFTRAVARRLADPETLALTV